MTIPNLIPMLLANRVGPFSELGIPFSDQFHPLTFNQDEQDLHQRLFLDRTENDYYLTAYLSALYSMPDIYGYIAGPNSFDLTHIRPIIIQPTGGRLTNFGSLDNDTELPLNFNYELRYVGNTEAAITEVERKRTTHLPVSASGSGGNTVLSVTWGSLPFTGSVSLNQSWTYGNYGLTPFTFGTRPCDFPYTAILDDVSAHPVVIQNIQKYDLINELSLGLDSVEKMSYVLLSLLLSRKEAYSAVETSKFKV